MTEATMGVPYGNMQGIYHGDEHRGAIQSYSVYLQRGYVLKEEDILYASR